MKLGKDFGFIARIILAILRAIMVVFEGGNDDTPGDGKDIK